MMLDPIRLAGRTAILPLLFTLAAMVQSANAATVRAVGTADLTSNSEFVFHGTAVEKWVSAGAKRGSIVTYVRFSVTDVLKGPAARKSVVLSYLGGTLQGRTLRVEGLKLPSVGDEGVFFVERLDRGQVHPLYGWDQGAFNVQTDAAGMKSVFTHDMRPVSGVAVAHSSVGISNGLAAGIVVGKEARDAVSLAEFKGRVRAIVESQQ